MCFVFKSCPIHPRMKGIGKKYVLQKYYGFLWSTENSNLYATFLLSEISQNATLVQHNFISAIRFDVYLLPTSY